VRSLLFALAGSCGAVGSASAQVLFDTTHYNVGGGFGFSEVDPGSQDIIAAWRSTSGASMGNLTGLGDWNVYLLFNDARTVWIYYEDWGGGQNKPHLVLSGTRLSDGGYDYMDVAMNTLWPNDNNMHDGEIEIIQAGGSDGLPYNTYVEVRIDGNLVPWYFQHLPANVTVFNTHAGGDYTIGWGSLIGISRISISEGAEILQTNSPIFLEGGALTTNYGYGDNFITIPDGDVQFTIDSCPGC
jgi:hypothetical protein